jgi:two-component system response regulator
VGKLFLWVVSITQLNSIDQRAKIGEGAPGESMDREIRIVLVEDDIEDAAFTKRVLKHNKLNKDLVVATTGKKAMQALHDMSEGNLPQLILLDINLPDISGIDLLTRIKEDKGLCSIPVVILTGSNEDQDIQKSYDLGASSYLVKPISNNAMMLVIEKLFSP